MRKTISIIDSLEVFYKANKIGTRSIRTSFAMILHDIGVAPYMIKMIGRWLSDAWLSYISHRLPDFSQDIAKKMVKSDAEFKNLPIPKQNIKFMAIDPFRISQNQTKKQKLSTSGTEYILLWISSLVCLL